jgi:hypothetical protein
VNTFQTDLASKLGVLSSTLNASIDQQNKHLKSVEHLCQSCVDSHDKVHTIVTLIGMLILDPITSMNSYCILTMFI